MRGHDQTRRDFLKGTAAITLAAGTMTDNIAQAGPDKPAQWIVACRDAHLKDTGEKDVWRAMRAINVQGIEVNVDHDLSCPQLFDPKRNYNIATDNDIRMLSAQLGYNSPGKITAFCLANRFDERGEDEIKLVDQAVHAAVEIGVPAIRLDVVPRKITDEKEFLAFAIKAGKQVVKNSEGTNVRFGVENHGGTTNKVEFLEALFDGIGSERFGLTLDTANFYWFGYPLSKLYEIYEKFGEHACHTHVKSINYPDDKRDIQRERGWEYGKYCCPIYAGDIDFQRVVKILRGKKYTGDLCIENESLGRFPEDQRRNILKREADLLHKLVSA